jgi:hypothetical protein
LRLLLKPKRKSRLAPIVSVSLAVVFVGLAVALVGQSSRESSPPAGTSSGFAVPGQSGTPGFSSTPNMRTPGYQGTPRMEGRETPGYRSTPDLGRPSPGRGMSSQAPMLQTAPSAARTPLP